MPGFPNRIARSSFGPTLKDKWPVVNPEHDVGAAPLNLLFWQVAGMNAAAARGLIQVQVNEGTGAVDTLYQGFAWDPNGTLPKIAWTRSAAGVYTYALPQAEYEDEQGNLVTVELLGGQPMPQALYSGNVVLGQHELTGPRKGTVHLYVPQLNSKRDVNFLLVLW